MAFYALLALFPALGALISIWALAFDPLQLDTIGLGPVVQTLLGLLRWPILFGVALIVLAIIYRYGPSRTPAPSRCRHDRD